MRKKFSSQNDPVKSWKAILTTLPESFCSKNQNISKTFQLCPRKFTKIVPLDTSIEVWQQCWKVFAIVNWVSAQFPNKMNRKKHQFFSFLPENVVPGTQNPALKNMLIFSGRTQLVFVLRRKKMAKFINVLKEPSFFKILRLTHRNHNRLLIRSVFLAKTLESFRLKSEKSGKKIFLRKLVFPQKVFLVALNATLEFWPDIFRKKGSNSLTKNSDLTKHSWCFQRKNIPPNVLQDN